MDMEVPKPEPNRNAIWVPAEQGDLADGSPNQSQGPLPPRNDDGSTLNRRKIGGALIVSGGLIEFVTVTLGTTLAVIHGIAAADAAGVGGVVLSAGPYLASSIVETAKLPLAAAATVVPGWKWKSFATVSAVVLMGPTFSNLTAAFRWPVDQEIIAVERAQLATAKARDSVDHLRSQRSNAEESLKQFSVEEQSLLGLRRDIEQTFDADTNKATAAIRDSLAALRSTVDRLRQDKEALRLQQDRDVSDVRAWNIRNPDRPRSVSSARHARDVREIDNRLDVAQRAVEVESKHLQGKIEELRRERLGKEHEMDTREAAVRQLIEKARASITDIDQKVTDAGSAIPDLETAEQRAIHMSKAHSLTQALGGGASNEAARRFSAFFVVGIAGCLTIAGTALVALGTALRYGDASRDKLAPPRGSSEADPTVPGPPSTSMPPTPAAPKDDEIQRVRKRKVYDVELIPVVSRVDIPENATLSQSLKIIEKEKSEIEATLKGNTK